VSITSCARQHKTDVAHRIKNDTNTYRCGSGAGEGGEQHGGCGGKMVEFHGWCYASVEVLFVFAKTKNYEIKLSYKLHEGWNEATCRPKCALT